MLAFLLLLFLLVVCFLLLPFTARGLNEERAVGVGNCLASLFSHGREKILAIAFLGNFGTV